MVLLVHAVIWALRVHGEAIKLTALAHREVADVDHFLNLAETFLVALAHFVRHQRPQAFFLRPKGVSVLTNDLTTLGRGPFAPFHKGVCGCSHHTFIVIVGRCGKRCNALAVDRRVAVDGRARTESVGANHDAVVLVLDAEVGKDVWDVHGAQRYGFSDLDRPSIH